MMVIRKSLQPLSKTLQMTEEEKLKAKLDDRYWRLNNLYWIQNQNGLKVKFNMNWAQEHFYRSMWYLNEVLKVRQIGISTLTGILQLDHALFNREQTCGLIDRTDLDAKRKMQKIRYAYEHLDDPDDPATSALGALIKNNVQLKTQNEHEISFTNGSKLWGGTSLRGSTVNFLHVSELGYIAHFDPKRASEIASGCFNTVHAGNIIIVEATHEGGRYGLNYELIRQAQRFDPSTATPLDWKFHFFPWWGEKNYTLECPGQFPAIPDKLESYFRRLETECDITLSPEQKFWYFKKQQSPKVDMARQYPGTAEEALAALTEGAIYGKQIGELRAQGRVRDFHMIDDAPLFTSWDLGQSDYHAAWLLQIKGVDIMVLDYWTGQRKNPGEIAAHMASWERTYKRPITQHYMPHDAQATSVVAKSMVQALGEAGITGISVVPRTPDIWVGIKHLRGLLPNFYFHATNCEIETESEDGILMPSGLGALEGYHQKIEMVGGRIVETPEHDAASHGCDALRTFAEAHQRGMVNRFSNQSAAISPYGRLKRMRLGEAKRGIRTPHTKKDRTSSKRGRRV
jgi:hypothetical protein